MPSALKRFKRKPKTVMIGGKKRVFRKTDWEGPGSYYHRGKGRFAKYSMKKDLHTTRPTTKKKLPAKFRHTHDSKVVRRKGKRIGKL
jgi:hypothetical protein